MSKIYMIVTNDEYETPVKTDVVGVKAVAEYMEVSESYVRKMLCGYKPFAGKYKVINMGEAGLTKKNAYKYKSVDRSEYFKEYYQRNKEKIRKKRNLHKYYNENKEQYNNYYLKRKLTTID